MVYFYLRIWTAASQLPKSTYSSEELQPGRGLPPPRPPSFVRRLNQYQYETYPWDRTAPSPDPQPTLLTTQHRVEHGTAMIASFGDDTYSLFNNNNLTTTSKNERNKRQYHTSSERSKSADKKSSMRHLQNIDSRTKLIPIFFFDISQETIIIISIFFPKPVAIFDIFSIFSRILFENEYRYSSSDTIVSISIYLWI